MKIRFFESDINSFLNKPIPRHLLQNMIQHISGIVLEAYVICKNDLHYMLFFLIIFHIMYQNHKWKYLLRSMNCMDKEVYDIYVEWNLYYRNSTCTWLGYLHECYSGFLAQQSISAEA